MALLIFVLLALLLVVLSLRERVKSHYRRNKNWDAIGEAKSSPLSQAMLNLIGTAGGIYLSLVLVQTFLEFDVPRQITLGGIGLEPLATLSIALAILQPFVIRLWLQKEYR